MSSHIKRYYKKKDSEGWKVWAEIYHKNFFGGITNITHEELTNSMNVSSVICKNQYMSVRQRNIMRQRPFKKSEAERMVQILSDKI